MLGMTAEAIKTTKKSKALGPDKLAPIHLHHLGPKGVAYLAHTISWCYNTSIIPHKWKVGKIIPLLKPGKDAELSKSYRPIALLSPVAKLAEKLLLLDFEQSVQLEDHQHGFRKERSTITALNCISDTIKRGLNKSKPCHRSLVVALDLTAAFDTVDHTTLLNDIYQSELPNYVKRWMLSYLQGRFTYTDFRGRTSRNRKMKQGVPQGGVLSPFLFNMYMKSMPRPPDNIIVVTYADDITLITSGPVKEELASRMNKYLEELCSWLESRNLILSLDKSTTTLFSTWSKDVSYQPVVKVNNHTLPVVKHPKILGVYFDNMMNFSHHINIMGNKLLKRNNVVKKIAGTNWGCSKETLSTTYKAIGRSVLNYAAPVWTPNLSDTNWKFLQRRQNVALRAATGCVRMTPIEHIHQETKILPVKEHSQMLSRQFLLGCHQPSRVDHCTVSIQDESRNIRPTLSSAFHRDIASQLHNNKLSPESYKAGLKLLHTNEVSNFRNKTSKLLGTCPPDIDSSEEKLDRSVRVKLSQLRSGYSTILNSYNSRIDNNIVDKCFDCQATGHTTDHLFNCPSRPTNRTTPVSGKSHKQPLIFWA